MGVRSHIPQGALRRETAVAFWAIVIGAVWSLTIGDIEGGALAVVGMGPLFVRLDRLLMPELLFGPLSFNYVYHAFAYTVGPLGQRYIGKTGESFDARGMMLGQWGAVLGLVVYGVVYAAVFSFIRARLSRDRRTGQDFEADLVPGYTLVLLLVAIALVSIGYASGSSRLSEEVVDITPGAVTGILSFQYIHRIVFFFLGWVAARRRGYWMALWLTTFLVYSAFQFTEGSRGEPAIAAVLSSIGLVLGGLSRRRVLLVLVGAFIVFLPVLNVVTWYRIYYGSYYSAGVISRVEGLMAAASDFSRTMERGEAGALDILFDSVTVRAVDRVMVMTPDSIPYVGLDGLDMLLYVWVPLQLYPDRPNFGDGNNASAEYGVGLKDGIVPGGGGARSYVYMPAVGEGYRRFGWAGVPIVYAFGGVMFGMMASLAWMKRGQREWMAMLVWVLLNAQTPMALTLVSGGYLALSLVPRYYLGFLFLRFVQDGARAVLRRRQRGTLAERSAVGS